MNKKAIHRLTVNIEAVCSANVTRYVLARWRARLPAYIHQSFVWRSQIVYKLAYSRRILWLWLSL